MAPVRPGSSPIPPLAASFGSGPCPPAGSGSRSRAVCTHRGPGSERLRPPAVRGLRPVRRATAAASPAVRQRGRRQLLDIAEQGGRDGCDVVTDEATTATPPIATAARNAPPPRTRGRRRHGWAGTGPSSSVTSFSVPSPAVAGASSWLVGTENVSQVVRSPESKPTSNQCWRAGRPWVHDSWLPLPSASSPTQVRYSGGRAPAT